MGNRNAVGKKGNGKLGNLAIVFVHGSFCPVDYFVLCHGVNTFLRCDFNVDFIRVFTKLLLIVLSYKSVTML